MTKTVTESINKILDEKLQEVDGIYNPACRKLTVHAEMISNYIQKVENSLQRSDDALESSKLKEFLSAQKDIDRDTQMLQDLTAFRIQVENPMPLKERLCFYTTFKGLTDKCNYHSLYSILDFDWLIHLQITACKYRSATNIWRKYFIEHAHFENASSASIKKISFFQNVNMARFAELSESE